MHACYPCPPPYILCFPDPTHKYLHMRKQRRCRPARSLCCTDLRLFPIPGFYLHVAFHGCPCLATCRWCNPWELRGNWSLQSGCGHPPVGQGAAGSALAAAAPEAMGRAARKAVSGEPGSFPQASSSPDGAGGATLTARLRHARPRAGRSWTRSGIVTPMADT